MERADAFKGDDGDGMHGGRGVAGAGPVQGQDGFGPILAIVVHRATIANMALAGHWGFFHFTPRGKP